MGRFWIKVFILGFLLLKQHAEVTAENPYDQVIENYFDSIIHVYEIGEDEEKLSAALVIWSRWNWQEDKPSYPQCIVDFDTAGLTRWIEKTCASGKHFKQAIDWNILKAYASIYTDNYKKVVIPVSEMDLTQKAVYFRHLAEYESYWNSPEEKFVWQFKRAIKLLKQDSNLWYMIPVCYRKLGSHYFGQNMLDSALWSFQNQYEYFNNIPLGKMIYAPGSYTYIKKSDYDNRLTLNLGMCYHKNGKFSKALDLFKTSIESYSVNSTSRYLFWAKRELINAYLDMGDIERSRLLFLEYLNDIKRKRNGKVYSSEYYLEELLSEFDYFDLRQNASFVDSIYKALESKLAPFNTGRIKKPSKYSYLQNLEAYSYRLLISELTDSAYNSKALLDTIKAHWELHNSKDFMNMELSREIGRTIQLLVSAWSVNDKDNGLRQFKDAFEHQEDYYNFRRNFDLALKILHHRKLYEIEIPLLESVLKTKKEGGESLTLWKLYHQLAEAYQNVGDYKRSNQNIQVYDELRLQAQQQRMHNQLAAFDKQLELEKIRYSEQVLTKENELNLIKRERWFITAVSAMVVIILSILLLINVRLRHKSENAKKELQFYALTQEAAKSEKSLENTTVELVKSNTSFQQLLKEIEGLTASMPPDARKKAKSLLVQHKSEQQDSIWKEFNLQFQNANSNFYQKLKELNDKLTDSEMRIAAMHVSGLSNKEISAITGQQLSSLHTLKSRLRKKLMVQDDHELLQKLKSI
ncbi:MAG: hypothetical protein JXQ87_08280 [Bacteroidia bacterium]